MPVNRCGVETWATGNKQVGLLGSTCVGDGTNDGDLNQSLAKTGLRVGRHY